MLEARIASQKMMEPVNEALPVGNVLFFGTARRSFYTRRFGIEIFCAGQAIPSPVLFVRAQRTSTAATNGRSGK
ncbi:hypothetical protein ABIB00_007424 [Bradyrhizobium sp. LB14.3]|uniref:hypothetical protein n=1 Tax=Bradyrhizobium sp. LB14.3 TaxID=3156328 RepID=UPI00339A4A23